MSKSCNTCPFAMTEESERVQNYGCLPDPCDINKMYKENKVWHCHGNEAKICEGLKEHIGSSFSSENKTPVLYSNWYRGTG